jgi:Na+/H+ antiporter NhaD/arsenite permease-like protein
MYLIIVAVFVLGYAAIALEHIIKINKTASAILTGVLCWTLFMFSPDDTTILRSTEYNEFLSAHQIKASTETGAQLSSLDLHREFVSSSLQHHLGEITQILFFLMGAMTIVELVDAHHGFRIITDRIATTNPRTLLWIVSWISFFLSSILDNLTTTIVMVSLIRKLVPDRGGRLMFASMIVIAANAGGAWTPIGDVTTTMLWIGGQITTLNIMKSLVIPSVVCMIIPLMLVGRQLKGMSLATPASQSTQNVASSKVMLFLGVGALVCVPVFKTITHLPPYCGILLGLGILWVVSEIINPEVDEHEKKRYSVAGALSRIDVSSVLFFLGILMAVAALESMQLLRAFATFLDVTFGDLRIIVSLIGILSAIVDNVPLVAASMGMYDINTYPADSMIWEYLAYCAGTGGSILIIGSAAGVAAMGMEKIDFIWYAKRISLIALAGYAVGAIVYLFMWT